MTVSPFKREVYRIVRSIPSGRVTSYGVVAALAGKPRAARGVGWALSGLPDGTDVPWWRVVNRNGEITTPRFNHLAQLQRALLSDEGVELEGGRIPLDRFGWEPPEDLLREEERIAEPPPASRDKYRPSG